MKMSLRDNVSRSAIVPLPLMQTYRTEGNRKKRTVRSNDFTDQTYTCDLETVQGSSSDKNPSRLRRKASNRGIWATNEVKGLPGDTREILKLPYLSFHSTTTLKATKQRYGLVIVETEEYEYSIYDILQLFCSLTIPPFLI